MNEDKNLNKEIKETEARLKQLKQRSRSDGKNPYVIPGAIVFAGVLIAGAVFFSGGGVSNTSGSLASGAPAPSRPAFDTSILDNIKPVTAEDHIKGSLEAPVKIVEFSDTECPFCKRFHPTMQRVIDEYGESGQVAWVYRHFPLDSIHSKARREAAATELANELGGNDAFWAYLDRIFEITPANDGLDLNLLPQIAEDVGLDRKPFEELVAANDTRGGKFADHIESDLQDAIASGGSGTPYSILIAPNGDKFPISGAQPYSVVKQIIDLALSNS